uniref:Uncharacterized protein n=1 Tax=Anguilla anguilla TaxID=7936 RepID=A0A0E9T1A6_ANGAN
MAESILFSLGLGVGTFFFTQSMIQLFRKIMEIVWKFAESYTGYYS